MSQVYLMLKIGQFGKKEMSNDCLTLVPTQEHDAILLAYIAEPNKAEFLVKVTLIPN